MLRKLSIILILILSVPALMAQDAPLYSSELFSLYPRKVVDGKNHAEFVADNALTSTLDQRKWLQNVLTNNYPQFNCDIMGSNTLYNLSLEELTNLWNKDNYWQANANQPTAKTHNLGYSSLLSLALIDPQAAQNSLMKRVSQGRIIQDDGTGGSWPVTTDRAVWVLGAWEVYLATGDKDWLKQSYEVVRHSLSQDEAMIYDHTTGLVYGEASLPYCRKEVYPAWMQPADIAQSECLSNNALFFRANEIASRMAQLCGDGGVAAHFKQVADAIKEGINNYLWIESAGYYGQYLYGRVNKTVSTRSETLGEALCIIFGIADAQRAQRIVNSIPSSPYGMTCFNPQIPDIYTLHNNAIWPHTQAYWLWASALTRCPQAVTHGLASVYRTTALMATNMENTDATTGTCNTAYNSGSALLSVAANLSIPLRVFAGINMNEEGITLQPLVPKGWMSKKQLTNLKYRKAILDITIQGYGDRVSAFYIDGKKLKEPFVSSSMNGRHSVRIVMNDQFSRYDEHTVEPVNYSPHTPIAWLDGATRMSWQQVQGVKEYKILRNGSSIAIQPESNIEGNYYDIPDEEGFAEYQVIAVDSLGVESFASEPLVRFGISNVRHYDMTAFAEPTTLKSCQGYSGNGAIEITSTSNTRIDLRINVPADGTYLIDFRYSNGTGSPTSGNSCASRMLWYNGRRVGNVVFPQRGKDLWSNWGYSTPVVLKLKQGEQSLVLIYELDNQNMSPDNVNRAILDHLRLIPLQ
ncbi:MAG: trehalase family glycosidase [Bacteroidales bacterium]|nr:trehalase family glycosidase [Bacteroidales bacterium]